MGKLRKGKKRRRSQNNEEPTTGVNVNSEDRSNECTSIELVLQPNQKIFLSHSGAQKEEFVDQLCVELERHHRFAFYDKRDRSLPKGAKFPELIKLAVKQCHVMVVVVSEDYFKSKWPMIELHAFIQASEKNPKMRILPLFFGLSVEEFNNKSRQRGWFKVWDTFAKADPERIKVDEWKDALKLVSPRNGIVYNRDSREVVAYRNEVVSHICSVIPADIKLEDSHVQGRSDLCKTTLCKTLCNDLDGVFNAKVCHVELPSGSEVTEVKLKVCLELLQNALNALTNTSLEFAKELNEDQCRDILYKKDSWKQKIFLAVDNVWDDMVSLEQARMYLKAPFLEGSTVIVTSRLLKTLTSLGIDENACFEMPELQKDDAKKLFLYYAADGKQFGNEEDVRAIEECIASCYFSKGRNQSSHYHPLALRALGVQIHYIGVKRPSEWVRSLPKIRDSSHLRGPRNPLFSILRSNFDRLPPEEQDLFMDVSIYFPRGYWHFYQLDFMEWLCLVHNEEIGKINDRLQHLKESAVLEDVDTSCGRVSMHDLYREFANLELEGRLDESIGLEKRSWLSVTSANLTQLDDTPGGRCWQNLKRVRISENLNLDGIAWEYFANLVILKLDGTFPLQLKLQGLKCLRSLDLESRCVHFERCSVNFIEGLEGLKNLTYIRIDFHGSVGQLPPSLVVLEVEGNVLFRRGVLELCAKLRMLRLSRVHAHDLDIRYCSSLEEVYLDDVTGFMSSSDLAEVPSLDPMVGSRSILSKLFDLRSLRRLRELKCYSLGLSEVPNLSGLEQLQVVDFSMNREFSSSEGLRDLPALRRLSIYGCVSLRRLPDLSKSTKLKKLDLRGSGIELREEDICMLARLTLLQPVSVNFQYDDRQNFRLDTARRKIMRGTQKALGMVGESSWVWEEKALGIPPIPVRDIHNLWEHS